MHVQDLERLDSSYWSNDESEYRYGDIMKNSSHIGSPIDENGSAEMHLFYTSLFMATTGYLLFFCKLSSGGIPFL